MANDPERQKLDELATRIHAAEGKTDAAQGKTSTGPVSSSNAGYEMVGTIVACVIVGWLMDRYLHTKPWGILGMLTVGFIAGIANVWRALNGYDQSVGLHKQDKK